jgi:hypothetical protein
MTQTPDSARGGRDWRVDTLRGYFLVMMTIAHLKGNPLAPFSEYLFGYASAPDGFVFLSGLVSGWVYLKTFEHRGAAVLESRALRRARDIYLVHISLLTLATTGAVIAGRTSFMGTHPLQALAGGSLLLYQPELSDILPMYCIFLLFTPLVLQQLVKGRFRAIAVISASLWVGSQFGAGDAFPGVPWIDLGHFNVLAWQAYFVAGLCFAWATRTYSTVIPKSRALLALAFCVALALFIDRHLQLIAGMKPLLRFSGVPNRNPVRFLDGVCLAYLLWWAPRSIDNKLKNLRPFRFLNLLGQHSLQVYAFSICATFAVMGLGYHWLNLPPAIQVLGVVLVVLALAIPARFHDLIRRRGPVSVLAVLTFRGATAATD